jgi:hypothetical protein
MFAEEHLERWWDRLSEDQRARAKTAAEKHSLDAAGPQLLVDTGCPVGPVGTKWEADPEWGWSWPESVREFVSNHP